MPSMTPSQTREMRWEYPAEDGQPFVLREGQRELGRLLFREEPEPSLAQFESERWKFHYSIRPRPHVKIWTEESCEFVAEYVPALTGGGMVTFASGARFRWKKSELLGSRWCFRSLDEDSSVCVAQSAACLTEGGKVSICCGAANRKETPLLLMLAWFLRVLDFEVLVEGMFRIG